MRVGCECGVCQCTDAVTVPHDGNDPDECALEAAGWRRLGCGWCCDSCRVEHHHKRHSCVDCREEDWHSEGDYLRDLERDLDLEDRNLGLGAPC